MPTDLHLFGLQNFGNTCYCNSVLQALYFCTPFRTRVLEHHDERPRSAPSPASTSAAHTSEPSLLDRLCELFAEIARNKKRTGVVSPRPFVTKLRRENEVFAGFQHQDAHEFLNFLLNHISETLAADRAGSDGDTSSVSTFVHECFGGILTNETRCLCCQKVSSRDEPFFDLSLEISERCSISACLRLFSHNEVLKGTDKFLCESCGSLQEAHKRMRVKRPPKVLVLHLKRFKYVESQNMMVKLNYRVAFPFELKLTNTSDDSEDPDRLYSLFAVVIHLGSGMSHGHYVALVKTNGRWLQFDDESVTPLNERFITQYYGASCDSTSTDTGYLLFYSSEPADVNANAAAFLAAATSPASATSTAASSGAGSATNLASSASARVGARA